MSVRHAKRALLGLCIAPLLALGGVAEAGTGERDAGAAPAPVSEALIQYRMNMFHPPVMTLSNRTIELMFETSRVEAGETAWSLPRSERGLDLTYEFDGARRSVADFMERTFTDAMLVIRDGRIVHEAYLNRTAPDTHFISYSIAKSFNSLMLGLAIQQGHVGSVEDPVTRYVPELAGSGYDGVSLRHLLQMRSGIDWNDNFFVDGPSRTAHLASFVRNEARYYDFAASATRKHPPGTVFNYNTLDSALVGLVVERAAAMPLSRFLSDHFWKPAGMESYAFYVLDGPPGVGREFTGGGFNATLRDYGRVGQILLDGGLADGRRILGEEWIRESSADSDPANPARPGLGYGYLWWTLPGTRGFTGIGGGGQYLFVDPESKTVIVKLSHTPVGEAYRNAGEEVLAFFRAVSAWR